MSNNALLEQVSWDTVALEARLWYVTRFTPDFKLTLTCIAYCRHILPHRYNRKKLIPYSLQFYIHVCTSP